MIRLYSFKIDQNMHAEHQSFDFNRGKACAIEAELLQLQAQVTQSPLFVLVMERLPGASPRFIGSTSIDLEPAITKALAARYGDRPANVTTRGEYQLFGLKGDRRGCISVVFRISTDAKIADDNAITPPRSTLMAPLPSFFASLPTPPSSALITASDNADPSEHELQGAKTFHF